MKLLPRPITRISRRKIVTIAAGFKCRDGIVLCADSQETSSTGYKSLVPKVVIKPVGMDANYSGSVAIFTGAGDAYFIDEVIEEMWSAGRQESALQSAIERMKAANLNYYQRIWQIYPAITSTAELPRADLLFALRVSGDCGLYEFHSQTFREVAQGYSTIGCGTDLAGYIGDSHVFSRCNDACILAVYMLEKVKDRVADCGGATHVAIMPLLGRPEILKESRIAEITDDLIDSEGIMLDLLFNSVDLEVADEGLKGLFEAYLDEIIERKKERRAAAARRKANMEKIREAKARNEQGEGGTL